MPPSKKSLATKVVTNHLMSRLHQGREIGTQNIKQIVWFEINAQNSKLIVWSCQT